MISRTRQYAKVSGYVIDPETQKPSETVVTVDTRSDSIGVVMESARRANKGFLPTDVEFHRDVYRMRDEDFYAQAEKVENEESISDDETVSEDSAK